MTALIELYANNANTVLASSITASSATLSVDPGTGSVFPTPVPGISFFRIVLTGALSPNTVEEVCYVTARSGDVFTVQRGQEGTTAVAWSVNDLVYNAVTAGTLSQFMQPYYGADTSASNNYVIFNNVASPSYFTGMVASFSSSYSNTIAAPTLNVNGIGAATIKNADGSALQAGQIQSNTIQLCYYNASDSSWRLQNPSYGQVISNLGYVPVNNGGDTMTGALTNSYGFFGPLNGTLTGAWSYMPAGTKVAFSQSSAPTGWSQVIDDSANNRMLRVVSSAGGGTGGSSNPVLNNVVPSHTHNFGANTGGQSNDHFHGVSGSTGGMSANASHSHGVNDPGHHHGGWGESWGGWFGVYAGPGYTGSASSDNNNYLWNSTTDRTNISLNAADVNHTHSFSVNSGGVNAGHTHSVYGTTDSGSSSTNWTPRYIDMILCSKD